MLLRIYHTAQHYNTEDDNLEKGKYFENTKMLMQRYQSTLLWHKLKTFCPSQWLHGLRRGSGAARLLGLWVQISLGAWLSLASVVCCQVEVSMLG
jgi:hypothetical protein